MRVYNIMIYIYIVWPRRTTRVLRSCLNCFLWFIITPRGSCFRPRHPGWVQGEPLYYILLWPVPCILYIYIIDYLCSARPPVARLVKIWYGCKIRHLNYVSIYIYYHVVSNSRHPPQLVRSRGQQSYEMIYALAACGYKPSPAIVSTGGSHSVRDHIKIIIIWLTCLQAHICGTAVWVPYYVYIRTLCLHNYIRTKPAVRQRVINCRRDLNEKNFLQK